MCLRHAYFQDKNVPGLVENNTMKSLSVNNLHLCVNTRVAIRMGQENLSLNEIREITQVVRVTVVTSKSIGKTPQREPYAEILAQNYQNYDQPANCSYDDHGFSDHSSVHSHNSLGSVFEQDTEPQLLPMSS